MGVNVDRPKCVMIGSGNVATHLSRALSEQVEITQVYSRQKANAEYLISQNSLNAYAIDSYNDITGSADLYIISLVDDAISDAIAQTPHITSGIWVHTSGSTPIEVFADKKKGYGVFYPLQTFSKDKKNIDFKEIPILLEANTQSTLQFLERIACAVTSDVRHVGSEGRSQLHISAVFACNFANYMWTVADSILREKGMDISIFFPLLKETLAKALALGPRSSQTGPARRGDFAVIKRHLEALPENYRRIYTLLTSQILELYNNNDTQL